MVDITGTVLPDFPTTNVAGEPSTLSQEMGENGLLVIVLRGTWCPFCVHQIVATRARYAHFQRRGININFIIPEEAFKVDGFRMTVSRALPFGLHADEDMSTSNILVGETEPRQIGVYLLNPERQVMWRSVGHDENYPTHQTVIEAIEQKLGVTLDQAV